MAKTVKPAATAESEDVVTVTAVEIIPKANEQQALELINPFKAMLVTLKEQYGNVQITDKASLEMAQKGVGTMTRLRNQIEERRLEIFRPVLDLQKKVKAEVDAFVKEVKLIEQPIRDTINAEELRLQQEAQQEHIRRITELQESGWTMVGQFYTCGNHRILFDQIDTAEPDQITAWVEMGQAELKRVADEKAAQDAKAAELDAREAALKQQEAELEEYRKWKAAQDVPVVTAPVVEIPAQLPPPPPPSPEPIQNSTPATQAQNVGTIVSQTTPDGEYTGPVPESLKELAQLRGQSISYLMSSPEFKVYWNMAVDNVLLRFTNEAHQKVEWIEIFKGLRK